MTCPHGFEFVCNKCREEELEDRRAKLKAGTHAYFVVPWRGDGRYHAEHTVSKPYKKGDAAHKYADRLNAGAPQFVSQHGGYVVRFLRVQGPVSGDPSKESA